MTISKNKKAFSLIELSIVVLIIGIIIVGIAQGSRLVEKMALSSARSLTKSSPVNSIRNLIAWYETTSEESFLSSVDPDSTNNTISIWRNINPTLSTKCDMQPGSTAAPSLTSSPPTLVKRAFGSLPGVYFDGVSNYLSCDDVAAYFTDVNINASIFLVINPIGTASTAVMSFSKAVSSSPLLRITNNNYHTSLTTAGGNNASVSTPNYKAGTNTINLFSFTLDGSNAVSYVNGVYKSTTDFSSLGPISINQLSLGAITRGTPQSFFNGYIGELIIFDRSLNQEEIDSIHKYLKQKWGIK